MAIPEKHIACNDLRLSFQKGNFTFIIHKQNFIYGVILFDLYIIYSVSAAPKCLCSKTAAACGRQDKLYELLIISYQIPHFIHCLWIVFKYLAAVRIKVKWEIIAAEAEALGHLAILAFIYGIYNVLWFMGCMVSSGTYSTHYPNIDTWLRVWCTAYELYKYHNLNDGGYCITLGNASLNGELLHGREWKQQSYNNDMDNKVLASLLFNHTQYEI